MTTLVDFNLLLGSCRLRKCHGQSWLLHPWMLGLSNFYGRLELDYEELAYQFGRFKGVTISEDVVRQAVKDYPTNDLAFLSMAPVRHT